jgi:hypothetical protein
MEQIQSPHPVNAGQPECLKKLLTWWESGWVAGSSRTVEVELCFIRCNERPELSLLPFLIRLMLLQFTLFNSFSQLPASSPVPSFKHSYHRTIMRSLSVGQILVVGLLAAGPLAAGFSLENPVHDVERRHVVRRPAFRS